MRWLNNFNKSFEMIQGWIVHNKIKRVSGENKVIIGDNIFTVSHVFTLCYVCCEECGNTNCKNKEIVKSFKLKYLLTF